MKAAESDGTDASGTDANSTDTSGTDTKLQCPWEKHKTVDDGFWYHLVYEGYVSLVTSVTGYIYIITITAIFKHFSF